MTIHAKRVTLQQKDMKLLHRVLKAYNISPYVDMTDLSLPTRLNITLVSLRYYTALAQLHKYCENARSDLVS